jgi:hypothetical protein
MKAILRRKYKGEICREAKIFSFFELICSLCNYMIIGDCKGVIYEIELMSKTKGVTIK